MPLMSREELESLGMTDAQLVAEAKRLFGIEPNILVDEDTKDVQRARRYAFDLVTEKWRIGKTHVIASTPARPSFHDVPEPPNTKASRAADATNHDDESRGRSSRP